MPTLYKVYVGGHIPYTRSASISPLYSPLLYLPFPFSLTALSLHPSNSLATLPPSTLCCRISIPILLPSPLLISIPHSALRLLPQLSLSLISLEPSSFPLSLSSALHPLIFFPLFLPPF